MDKYSESLSNVKLNMKSALHIIHSIDNYLDDYGTSIPVEDIDVFDKSSECLISLLAKIIKSMSDDGIVAIICNQKITESSNS